MTTTIIGHALAALDRTLVNEVAAVVAEPRRDPADSFALHAPLEVLARAELLTRSAPEYLADHRVRLAEVAEHYGARPAADDPGVLRADPESCAVEVLAALETADVDRADRAAQGLVAQCPVDELVHLLAEPIAPLLTAAGHGPIFLQLLARHRTDGDHLARMLRPLVRELVRWGEHRLEWVDAVPLRPGSAAELATALDGLRGLGEVGNGFILPTMRRIDGPSVESSLAATALAGVVGGDDIAGRARMVVRGAAWSMVRQPDEHAPYGWTHALTMPLAVLSVAGSFRSPSRALAIAASHLAGFRLAYATGPAGGAVPADPGVVMADALDDPVLAGAAALHLPAEQRTRWWAELAGRAGAQRDAHLAKYTVACGDAARMDPDAEGLYLAAAATLAAWWSQAGPSADH